jgi:uncharacterized phage protein gp47/JayE
MDFLDFNTIVTNLRSKAQQYSTGLVDFTIGKIWNTVTNLIADNTQYQQGLVYEALMRTRLTTSTGSDVDSFIADYQFSRLPAVTATGSVTLSRYDASVVATIPVGANVKTFDGLLQYSITEDATHPDWSNSLGVYVVPVGNASITVPITATAAGASYNTQPNTITLIASSLAGINLVNNQTAISNGVDAESDDAVKARFWQFLNTKSLGTAAAIEYAVSSVQANLSYNVVSNDKRTGFFSVYLDDGTGSPPPSLIASVSNAVAAVAPFTVDYQVYPAEIVYVTVSVSVYPKKGYDKTTVGNNVAYAIENLINNAGVSDTVRYYDVATVANNVEGVDHIENLFLNGAIQDIGGAPNQSVHVSTVSIA